MRRRRPELQRVAARVPLRQPQYQTAELLIGAVSRGFRVREVPVTVYAVATPIHRGRSQQLWVTTITDENDRLVARGQVRLQNLADQQGGP